MRGDTSLQGLTPEYIKQRASAHVISSRSAVRQVREQRPYYSHREFYYKVVFPEPGFPNGVFVEYELTDSDPELPCVTICNAHPQSR